MNDALPMWFGYVVARGVVVSGFLSADAGEADGSLMLAAAREAASECGGKAAVCHVWLRILGVSRDGATFHIEFRPDVRVPRFKRVFLRAFDALMAMDKAEVFGLCDKGIAPCVRV